LSTLIHATVYMFLHNLLNVLVQIANKMGLQKRNLPAEYGSYGTGVRLDPSLRVLGTLAPPACTVKITRFLFIPASLSYPALRSLVRYH
jgi:hypothetical protein